ncbi:MAG: putative Ig domain-containing protein, partial [Bacteroidota bacterium]
PYTVQINVADGCDPPLVSSVTFTWTITLPNLAPEVTSPGDQVSNVGDEIALQIAAQDDAPCTGLSYEATGLPASLSIDPGTGLISGTLLEGDASETAYQVQVTVADGCQPPLAQSISFTWTVETPNVAPEVTSPGDQASEEGDEISLQIVATDDEDCGALSYTALGLPAGLSIDEASGLITGTIEKETVADSPYDVTVTVADACDPALSQEISFSWAVTTPVIGLDGLTITATLQNNATHGGDYAVKLYPLGSNVPTYDLILSADNSGTMTTTGIAAGTYQLAVKFPNSLQVVVQVTVEEGSTTVDVGELPMGDANNDNVVSSPDFSLMGATYNRSVGSPGYDGRADFNGDDVVSAADFSILISNFNRSGEVPSAN